MAEAVLQLNKSEQGYFRIPYAAFKTPLYGNGSRSMRRAELALYGFISSISRGKEACNMSYNRFAAKLNLSRGTVARGLSALKNAGVIVQDKSHRSCAAYTCEKANKSGIMIEVYLYHTKFTFRGEAEPRFLKDSEINVLSLMKTHCTNPKGNGIFVGSVRGIEKTLHLSHKTVQQALCALFRAELIFRAEGNKGVNGYQRSGFMVNAKLLRNAKKKYRKATDPKIQMDKLTQSVCDADVRAERERYYNNLQNLADSRAEAFRKQLEADSTYELINNGYNGMEAKLARAEIYFPERLGELMREKQELSAKRAKRMAELGISEADLIPRYRCSKCSDSGFLPNGKMCSCYPRRGYA